MKAVSKKADVSKHRDFEKISKDFADGSESAYTFEYYNAAGVLVIHAAIALADSITVKLAGKKCSGNSHYDIIELLRQVTPSSANKNKALEQFKKLIDHKNQVSYHGDIYFKKDVDKLFKYFTRFKDWAESLPKN
ncbi:MAG: hypothetical protein HXY50_04305 [Ignavibacteriaceae bacterium]|nr:hypothetical protein [Ignavibacteriaceae bacterium]